MIGQLVAGVGLAFAREFTDQSILDKQGKDYFESKMPSEKKPVKIQKPKK